MHRHLKNIDCLSHLVCFISTVNGRSNKKRKEEAYSWKAGASSGHVTNLKQSILETFDIYGRAISGLKTADSLAGSVSEP